MDRGAFYDDTETWQDRRGYRLSDRLWSNRQRTRSVIDDVIRQGIRDGATLDEVANELLMWIRPGYSPYGGGKAQYAATRLAGNEMRRARSQAARQVALTDPAGGFMQFDTAPSHIEDDACTDHANHNEGYGRGVWPAEDCPLPPIHVGCACEAEMVRGVDRREMSDVVEALRVEYGLADPPDLSPEELAVFRRETAQVRRDVVLMFNGWFEQTGLVSREQLMEASPSVRAWVESVRAEKRRRRA